MDTNAFLCNIFTFVWMQLHSCACSQNKITFSLRHSMLDNDDEAVVGVPDIVVGSSTVQSILEGSRQQYAATKVYGTCRTVAATASQSWSRCVVQRRDARVCHQKAHGIASLGAACAPLVRANYLAKDW